MKIFGLLLLLMHLNAHAIIDGTEAVEQDKIAKSAVLIVCLEERRSVQRIVGSASGVIVGDGFILTAAHTFSMCKHGRDNRRRAQYRWEMRFGLDERRMSRAIVPFSPADFLNEDADHVMAPLHIAHDKFKDYLFIRIPGGLPQGFVPMRVSDNPIALKKGAQVYLSGYGFTGAGTTDYKLRTAQLTVTSTDPSTPGMRPLDKDLNTFDKAYYLDAYSPLQNPCHGDSGGPFYLIENDEPVLVGILTHLQTNLGKRAYCDAPSIGLRADGFSEELMRITKGFDEAKRERQAPGCNHSTNNRSEISATARRRARSFH